MFKQLLEGIFDTGIFKEYAQKYTPPKLSEEEQQLAKIRFDYPSIMISPDEATYGTLEAWLYRISRWGSIKITRKDPEDKINKEITRDEFLDYVDNQIRNNYRGRWDVNQEDVNIIKFSRRFWSILGKEIIEEMVVTVNLRPEIKKIFKKVQKQ